MLSAQNRNRFPEQRPFPDVILKSQYFDFVGSRALSSEQRLMLAVLADAINVVQDGNRSPHVRRRSCFAEARHWIFHSSVQCALSFESVCEALRIDADALRQRLKSMSAVDTAQPPARLRLQLKEASRFHRMTANRIRVRGRRSNTRLNPA